MRPWVAFLCSSSLVTCSCAAAGASSIPTDSARPIAIWIQTDPWSMVLGSDTPRVAVYEDGEVVFAKKVNETYAYHHFKLDAAGLAAVRQRLTPVVSLTDLRPHYDLAPSVTDQPSAIFYVRDGERSAATSVYGLMAPGTKLPGFTQFGGGPKPDVLPAALAKLHEWFVAVDDARSTEWVPRTVEVMLWDYSHAPESSIVWPKGWPSLDSDRAIRRGDSYSIFLDGSLLPRLKEFLASRNARGAVEIAGRKMAAAYRFTFPGEEEWRKALAAKK